MAPSVSSSRKEIVFRRAFRLCRKPSRAAYSSAKTDSRKKDKISRIERSIKLFFLNTRLIAFLYQASGDKQNQQDYQGNAHYTGDYIVKAQAYQSFFFMPEIPYK